MEAKMQQGCKDVSAGGRAVRTDSFHHIIDGIHAVALRQRYRRYMDIVKTESPPATEAIEMDVDIVILAFFVAMAKFITDRIASVFDHMDEMILLEKSQRSGYHRFVDRIQDITHFSHGKRARSVAESFRHQNPVGRGFHPMVLHQIYHVSFRHMQES